MRSDVRLIIKEDGLDIIRGLCDKAKGRFQENLISRSIIHESVSDLEYIGWNRLNAEDFEFIKNALYLVEEKDITYKIAIIGENYEDTNMYEYVSEKDKDSDIPMPYVERKFNEDEIRQGLQSYLKEVREKNEIETIEYE